MFICLYVTLYVCMSVCLYVCMYIYVHMELYLYNKYVWICVYIDTKQYVNIYIKICIYTCGIIRIYHNVNYCYYIVRNYPQCTWYGVYDQQVIQIYPDHATQLQVAGVFQWPPRLCRNTVQIVPSKAKPPRDFKSADASNYMKDVQEISTKQLQMMVLYRHR